MATQIDPRHRSCQLFLPSSQCSACQALCAYVSAAVASVVRQ